MNYVVRLRVRWVAVLLPLLAVAIGLLAGQAGAPVAQAAAGDGLTQIVRPAGCTGIGVAFDGTDVLYTCGIPVAEPAIFKTDLAGNDNGSVPTADAGGNPVSVDAIAWDPDLNVLWGGDLDGAGNCQIWTIDMTTGLATPAFSFVDVHGGCDFFFFDGLTVDTVTDTLWLSPDVHSHIHHYTKAGVEIAADLIDFETLTSVPADRCPNTEPLPDTDPAVGGCNNSGLTIGLDGNLFAGTDGEGKIIQLSPGPPAAFIGEFATVTGRDEDLECGPPFTRTDGVTVETILSADLNENKIDVLEAPPETCLTPTTPGFGIKKDPNLANLWLCNIAGAPGCDNKESGVEELNLNVRLNERITSPDPKCTGFPNFRPASECPAQKIGAFEFEVRYDAKLVTLHIEPGDLFRRRDVSCDEIHGEGFVQFRCVTKGKPEEVPSGPGTLVEVRIRATPDVYSILVANQLNGIATQLINQDCQLADLQGHPIPIPQGEVANNSTTTPHDFCGDAAVTIRYLEGDVHADCRVDVHDQQQIAFRWGSRLGQLLFNDRFDLEPSAPKKGDDDIDAKDLQLVYGRHGSTCKAPHPPQPPVDPKAKVEPPLPE